MPICKETAIYFKQKIYTYFSSLDRGWTSKTYIYGCGISYAMLNVSMVKKHLK